MLWFLVKLWGSVDLWIRNREKDICIIRKKNKII